MQIYCFSKTSNFNKFLDLYYSVFFRHTGNVGKYVALKVRLYIQKEHSMFLWVISYYHGR